jgi:hypothetical protein
MYSRGGGGPSRTCYGHGAHVLTWRLFFSFRSASVSIPPLTLPLSLALSSTETYHHPIYFISIVHVVSALTSWPLSRVAVARASHLLVLASWMSRPNCSMEACSPPINGNQKLGYLDMSAWIHLTTAHSCTHAQLNPNQTFFRKRQGPSRSFYLPVPPPTHTFTTVIGAKYRLSCDLMSNLLPYRNNREASEGMNSSTAEMTRTNRLNNVSTQYLSLADWFPPFTLVCSFAGKMREGGQARESTNSVPTPLSLITTRLINARNHLVSSGYWMYPWRRTSNVPIDQCNSSAPY